MKNLSNFEDTIFDSGELIKRAGKSAFDNMSKLIALFVAVIMVAVTFTDVSFGAFFTEQFFGSLLLLITSSYIIYFSLEDAGEHSGMTSDEYKSAAARYCAIRDGISGEHIEPLREFCREYSEREVESRRKRMLIAKGITPSLLEDYRAGTRFDKRTERILRRAERIRREVLTPAILLSRDAVRARSELQNPERLKLIMLIIKLIPSTVCMTVTVSVMLSAKYGMTASDILNGILKLSALPLIGFRGFCAGYSYSKHRLSLWLETKANILESFLKEG